MKAAHGVRDSAVTFETQRGSTLRHRRPERLAQLLARGEQLVQRPRRHRLSRRQLHGEVQHLVRRPRHGGQAARVRHPVDSREVQTKRHAVLRHPLLAVHREQPLAQLDHDELHLAPHRPGRIPARA